MKTILVIEDHLGIRELVQEYLEAQGYRVLTANNGKQGLYTARYEHPHLILLDIMMPEMDGYAFIRNYRKESEVPIILITAKLEEVDKVVGLELGADDYITKPFGMAELLARVRAVLRRSEQTKQNKPNTVLTVGHLSMDTETHWVRLAGQKVELTPSEFVLLGVLMQYPGRVFRRIDLLEHLQEDPAGEIGSERTIDVHIRNLRAKLEPEGHKPKYIQTVFGVGYRLGEG
jgi:DNA-binding response OmpR family regulator